MISDSSTPSAPGSTTSSSAASGTAATATTTDTGFSASNTAKTTPSLTIGDRPEGKTSGVRSDSDLAGCGFDAVQDVNISAAKQTHRKRTGVRISNQNQLGMQADARSRANSFSNRSAGTGTTTPKGQVQVTARFPGIAQAATHGVGARFQPGMIAQGDRVSSRRAVRATQSDDIQAMLDKIVSKKYSDENFKKRQFKSEDQQNFSRVSKNKTTTKTVHAQKLPSEGVTQKLKIEGNATKTSGALASEWLNNKTNVKATLKGDDPKVLGEYFFKISRGFEGKLADLKDINSVEDLQNSTKLIFCKEDGTHYDSPELINIFESFKAARDNWKPKQDRVDPVRTQSDPSAGG